MKTSSEYANELLTKLDGYHEAYIGPDETPTDSDRLNMSNIAETFFRASQDEIRASFNAAWEWSGGEEEPLEALRDWWEGDPEAMAQVDAIVNKPKPMFTYDIQQKVAQSGASSGCLWTTEGGDIEKVKAYWKQRLEPNHALISVTRAF